MSDKNKSLAHLTKAIDLVLIKAEGEAGDGNTIKAMVTTWNDPDKGDDVFLPEAFDDFLTEFRKPGAPPLQMHLNHETTTLAGEWHTFTKTDKGLVGEGIFFDDLEDGKKAKRQIDRGMIKSVSIGIADNTYFINDEYGRTFVKSTLREVSLVPFPANTNAEILEVKAEKPTPDISVADMITKAFDKNANASKTQAISNHFDKVIATLKGDDNV